MQDLPTYLNGKKQSDFAKQVNISDAYLSQILSRVRVPSYEVAQKISDATDGKVPVSSWVDWKKASAPEASP